MARIVACDFVLWFFRAFVMLFRVGPPGRPAARHPIPGRHTAENWHGTARLLAGRGHRKPKRWTRWNAAATGPPARPGSRQESAGQTQGRARKAHRPADRLAPPAP